ncbi:LysR family transcriptional regulator [Streptomyces rhizosphaericus]|uniref:LysR family transcriptional regulator n=1 Tax=Streptomyces rhizosphaericus TaxID=114699 RepID=UPI003631B825
MDIDARKLAVLLAVHRAGGVLAAADVLHLTPSAVSQQIARLESAVGVTVLDRQPRGAVLTQAGRVLAETAERIESELTDARKALAALQGEVTGTVVISAFKTVIRMLLVPLVHGLREQFPGLELLIREMDGEKAQQELRSGAVDLIILEAETPSATGPRAAPAMCRCWRNRGWWSCPRRRRSRSVRRTWSTSPGSGSTRTRPPTAPPNRPGAV